MTLDTRNAKREPRTPNVSVTSAELATLLGPNVAVETMPTPIAMPTAPSDIRWTSFAEEFARVLTGRLRPLLRAAVRVTTRDCETILAETLGLNADTTTVVRSWQSAKCLESLGVSLSAPLVATFVDRLLGGRQVPNGEESEQHRPLTAVDARLAARLLDAVRESLGESVAAHLVFDLDEVAADSTSLVDAWLPDSSLLRLTFDLRFVQGGGTLDLLLPIHLANSLADAPTASETSLRATSATPHATVPKPVRRSTVVAQLAELSVPRADLQSLAIGDVLLANPSDSSMRVLIDGQPRFVATPGTIDGRKAIRLASPERT